MFNKIFAEAAAIIGFAVYQFIEGYIGNGIFLSLSTIFIFLYFEMKLFY